MKNSIIHMSIIVLTGTASTLYAQTKYAARIPAAVTTAFSKAHPKIKAVWEEEKGTYEAGFIQNKQKMSELYSPAGVKTESEVEIKVSLLPDAIKQYVKTHYKGMSIREGAKISKISGEVNYEAAIEGKDLIFDHKGKFIKEAKD